MAALSVPDIPTDKLQEKSHSHLLNYFSCENTFSSSELTSLLFSVGLRSAISIQTKESNLSFIKDFFFIITSISYLTLLHVVTLLLLNSHAHVPQQVLMVKRIKKKSNFLGKEKFFWEVKVKEVLLFCYFPQQRYPFYCFFLKYIIIFKIIILRRSKILNTEREKYTYDRSKGNMD